MTRPIRVLHVFGRLDSGGAESRTMDIYRNIDRNKVQFDFAIHTNEKCFFTEEVISLGGRIFNFSRFKGSNYLEYSKEWKEFFAIHDEYKIIHGHQTNTGFVYLKEAKRCGIPIRIAHSRNSNKENILKKYICKLAKIYATDLFAVSKLAGISEFGKKSVSRGMVKIFPNAIDARKYKFNKIVRKQKRAEFGMENELILCHIGRFHPQKNHEFLLDIFKEITLEIKSAKLILIGDGSLRNNIKNKISELGLEEAVILAGIRKDVPKLLSAMDLLIFPSVFEGLPGVVLEAQAAGLPCFISNAITDEVCVTNLVKYLPINEGTLVWKNEILLETFENNRKDTYNEIREAGFDVRSVAKLYENYYLSKI